MYSIVYYAGPDAPPVPIGETYASLELALKYVDSRPVEEMLGVRQPDGTLYQFVVRPNLPTETPLRYPQFSQRVNESIDALEALAELGQSGEQGITIECDEAPFMSAQIRVVLAELKDASKKLQAYRNEEAEPKI